MRVRFVHRTRYYGRSSRVVEGSSCPLCVRVRVRVRDRDRDRVRVKDREG